MHLVLDRNRALVDELMENFSLSKATAERCVLDWQEGRNLRLKEIYNEQLMVGAQNAREQHRSVDGLGQCTQRLSARFEDALIQLYGAESIKDPKWMRKLDREWGLGMQPHYDKKARIIVDKPVGHAA